MTNSRKAILYAFFASPTRPSRLNVFNKKSNHQLCVLPGEQRTASSERRTAAFRLQLEALLLPDIKKVPSFKDTSIIIH